MSPWIVYLALWLLLGIIADKLCEFHAKKEDRKYERSTAVACYLLGPVIIPLALAYALVYSIRHFFRH